MPKSKNDGELWTALGALDDDLLDPNVPDTIIDEELKALDVDPAALAERGIEFATQAKEKKRLGWQVDAEKRRADLQARAKTAILPATMNRQAMLARLDELRGDPQLGTAIRMAAHKRKPEESSDEELRTLVEEMEALRAIEDDDRE